MVKVLIVVGGLVLAFMLYLVLDWLRGRLAMRKFEARRRKARAEWQQELKDLKDARDEQQGS